MNLKEINLEPDRALPCIDLAGARFITVPITLPGRPEGRLCVGVTKDSVLVVQLANKVRASYNKRHILVVDVVAVKHRLEVEPHTLTSVVFLGGEFEDLVRLADEVA